MPLDGTRFHSGYLYTSLKSSIVASVRSAASALRLSPSYLWVTLGGAFVSRWLGWRHNTVFLGPPTKNNYQYIVIKLCIERILQLSILLLTRYRSSQIFSVFGVWSVQRHPWYCVWVSLNSLPFAYLTAVFHFKFAEIFCSLTFFYDPLWKRVVSWKMQKLLHYPYAVSRASTAFMFRICCA